MLLARELNAEASVVIFNKPTYGLDLQNTRLAHERILAGAEQGLATIVISTDLDELLEISDRDRRDVPGAPRRHGGERPGRGAQGRPADDGGEGGMTDAFSPLIAPLPPLRGKVAQPWRTE